MACWILGDVYLMRGDLPDGITQLERALALCHDWEISYVRPSVMGVLGHAHVLAGRTAQGHALLRAAVDEKDRQGWAYAQSLTLAWLGEAALDAAEPEEALALATRALALARERRERGNEAQVLRLFGEIGARRDPPDVPAAADGFGRALAQASELGMRPLVARCHGDLARLYQKIGKADEASEHRAAAAARSADRRRAGATRSRARDRAR